MSEGGSIQSLSGPCIGLRSVPVTGVTLVGMDDVAGAAVALFANRFAIMAKGFSPPPKSPAKPPADLLPPATFFMLAAPLALEADMVALVLV